MAEQKVSLNLLGLPISLRFKRMKYARIRINKECEISVSVPHSYTAAQAEDFILKHESWIHQTLERLQSKLLASDQVRILGKIYKLKFSREVGFGTNCGANESLGESGVRGCVDDDASSDAGSVNSAHLQNGAGISSSGSANNAMSGMNDGADSGAGSEILKFHSCGCVPQSSDAGEFNSASSGEILKFNPAARDGILKFKPDFTIKNFIQSSKFKDKIFVSEDTIFCESEGEFATFKKAFALELYLRYIEKFSPRIDRKIARVRVRKMQTRWGSCNHAKGYLNFSLNLIERDPRFVEYVVLHELTHLIHANHGADFYALIAQIMPDFRARIKLGKG